MAKRKHKPHNPSMLVQGDIGPQTPAQMRQAVILTIREDNGAQFRRKRTDHALEIMHKGKKISQRQMLAGLELHRLHCQTQLSPDSAFTRAYVDASPRPGDVSVMQAERNMEYAKLARHIPRGHRGPVEHVCLKGRCLRDGYSRDGHEADMHTALLQVALDILANELRY